MVWVDAQFPCWAPANAHGARRRPRPIYATSADHREIWPMVVEKAYAKVKGSYEAIGRGGVVAAALETLTGGASWSVSAKGIAWKDLMRAVEDADARSQRGKYPRRRRGIDEPARECPCRSRGVAHRSSSALARSTTSRSASSTVSSAATPTRSSTRSTSAPTPSACNCCSFAIPGGNTSGKALGRTRRRIGAGGPTLLLPWAIRPRKRTTGAFGWPWTTSANASTASISAA